MYYICIDGELDMTIQSDTNDLNMFCEINSE
jgi:hypothetical protein